MKAILELHILQNFSPSNLNRDDTGSPKDTVFGGSRRARISSQCQKRAMRTYVQEHQLLAPGHLAIRTKRLLEALTEKLVKAGRSQEDAERASRAAFAGLGLKAKEEKTQYLLFLGEREISNIAETIEEHWENLLANAPNEDSKAKGKSNKDAKKAAKAAIPKEIVKALDKTLRDRGAGGDAVDLALFGRMLTDNPKKNQNAACQVAHALSTHTVNREFDFYTAVDDRKPEDNAGADMLGTIEFNSACYYRYLNIDINLLGINLQKDDELFEAGLHAFLKAAVLAVPSGKQNSHAAHNPPSLVAFCLRKDTSPRNLANAFAKPARASGDKDLIQASMAQLHNEWQKLDEFYGDVGECHFWSGGTKEFQQGTAAKSLEALLEASVKMAKAALKD